MIKVMNILNYKVTYLSTLWKAERISFTTISFIWSLIFKRCNSFIKWCFLMQRRVNYKQWVCVMIKLWLSWWRLMKQWCLSNKFFCKRNELNSWIFATSDNWLEFLSHLVGRLWFKSGCIIRYSCVFVMRVRFRFRLRLRLGFRKKFTF